MLSCNMLNDVSSFVWYLEIRVGYRRTRLLFYLLMSSCYLQLGAPLLMLSPSFTTCQLSRLSVCTL